MSPERRARQREAARRWRQRNLERSRAIKKQSKYGITPEQFAALKAEQGGCCALCQRPEGIKTLHIDHDHVSGRVRGLLCELCNKGLGMFRDNSEAMRRAARYIEDHSTES